MVLVEQAFRPAKTNLKPGSFTPFSTFVIIPGRKPRFGVRLHPVLRLGYSRRPHNSMFLESMKIRLAVLLLLSTSVFAQGTRTWEQSRFDDFEKGTPKGVAIRSDGNLELAPAMKVLYTTPSTYIWSVASDDHGNVYAAAGAPARVYRITPEGQATVIVAPSELQVQALVVDKAGVVYAATAPEGKVYRIEPKAATATATPGAAAPNANAPSNGSLANVAADPNFTSSVFFDPKTKYIWALALDAEGRLYIATGDRGEIFRVERTGVGSVFFKSDEAHIRTIAFDQKGNLIAGSDGSGLVYRISPAGEAFVLYSAPKKEITALAIDPQGNIFAAGAGEKRAASSLPQNQGQLIVPPPITLAPQAGSAPGAPAAAAPNTQLPIPGLGATGSEIYRIAPDGSPKRIWTSREDLVYALGFDADGHLIAGTGNKGKIFSIDEQSRFTDLIKLSANQVIGFARGPDGATYAATSNLGKIFALQNSAQRDGTYESDVFDAKIFSRWGRLEARGRGNVEYFARSGNVDNPDRNWSPWRKIDTQKDPIFDAPSARFIQWRAVLHSGNPAPAVDSVIVNYLPKNVAPEVDDVSVQVGYRFQAIPRTVSQVDNSGDPYNAQASMAQNLAPQRDRDSIAVRWAAHDENDDQLVYRIYYRGDKETRWKLLKADLVDRFYSFRVVASDEPAHSPDESLSAERESPRFEVDNTPPVVANLAAVVDADQLHITFTANDTFSVIRRAEFSIDAGDWQYVAPVGEISDARLENYDFYVPVPITKPMPSTEIPEPTPATAQANQKSRAKRSRPAPVVSAPAEEHTIVVRVYDRFDNMGNAKVVVHPAAPPAAK
jgi:sugar lactone lactonase YvrE